VRLCSAPAPAWLSQISARTCTSAPMRCGARPKPRRCQVRARGSCRRSRRVLSVPSLGLSTSPFRGRPRRARCRHCCQQEVGARQRQRQPGRVSNARQAPTPSSNTNGPACRLGRLLAARALAVTAYSSSNGLGCASVLSPKWLVLIYYRAGGAPSPSAQMLHRLCRTAWRSARRALPASSRPVLLSQFGGTATRSLCGADAPELRVP
jgi:hypothetical protein